MKKQTWIMKLLGLGLALTLAWAGCVNPAADDSGPDNSSGNAAKTPVITVAPEGADYTVGDELTGITVTATVTEGSLTYQWYESASATNTNGVPIEGATEASYIPDGTIPGTRYYYVVVTSTGGITVTSSAVAITVAALEDAAYPAITAQPEGGSFVQGSVPALSVTATVTKGVLTYQWYEAVSLTNMGGTPIDGATAETYAPGESTTGVTRYYYVEVTNTDSEAPGETTAVRKSDPVGVTIAAPVDAETPAISAHPASNTYLEGGDIAPLTVTALVAEGTLTYQWYKPLSQTNEGGTPIESATTNSYTPLDSAVGTTYYYVVVTNTDAAATGQKTVSIASSVAVITIGAVNDAELPNITGQPAGGNFYSDEEAVLTVSATVTTGALSYQWYDNTVSATGGGTELTGQTSASYTVTLSEGQSKYYYVKVSNYDVSATGAQTVFVYSDVVQASIVPPPPAETPVIQTQPTGGTWFVVQSPALTVSATGTGVLSYQWYSNASLSNTGGSPIEGETAATYTISNPVEGTAYYYVVVTNYDSGARGEKTATVTSSPVGVSIIPTYDAPAPAISVQPLGGVSFAGEITLSVTATASSGPGPLSYQWYSNTSLSNTEGSSIDGATSASYTPPGATTAGTKYYYVVVTNTDNSGMGNPTSLASTPVMVTILASPNVTLTVNNSTKKQFIRGVGGMSDQCFIYGNGSWTDRVTLADIQSMFGHGAQELGLNMYRLLMYPYLEEGITYTGPQGALTPGDPNQGIVDDTTLYQPGPSGGSKSGTLAANQSDYYNIIKKVNEMGGYVILCPWIIPLEFTTNSAGTALGSGAGKSTKVDKTKFEDLANWYVSYIQNLVNHGAPIFALSVQNEPDQGVEYDGCIWSGTDQRDMIRILGPKLEQAGLTGYGGGRQWDKIWLATGENAGLPGTAGDNVINDTGGTGASQYVEIATRHLYGGMGPYTNGISAIANASKGLKEIWQTEHCDTTGRSGTGATMYNAMSGWNWVWHIANETYNTFALNQESAFIWWTSKRFYGFIGEGDYTTSNGAVLPRGHVMAHFGKYVLNTNLIGVTASGSFVSNAGIAAAAGSGSLGATTLPVSSSNLNPTSFTSGNSDSGGQNQPTTKVMAFEADDGSYISVVAFTPTRNSGYGGQDAGNVRINLPSGFVAASAELMRSNSSVKQHIEAVPMNSAGTAAVINLPKGEIVSVKFIR